jgi:hypothetical protein
MSNTNLKPAVAIQDDSGHWYVIPAEMEDDFHTECASAYLNGETDFFDDKYSKYLIGNNLYSVQLYAIFPN